MGTDLRKEKVKCALTSTGLLMEGVDRSGIAIPVDKSLLLDCHTIVHRSYGNTAEIELLYRQHGSALLLFALTITGERGRAQDAVHHVFLNLIEKGSLSRAADKKAYVFACVRNAALNEAKRLERMTPIDCDSAWFHPPDRDYVGEENLRRALGNIPDDQREVIVLHVWGELTFSQISELVGVSSNTVASRYRYALGKLRDLMLPKEDCVAKP